MTSVAILLRLITPAASEENYSAILKREIITPLCNWLDSNPLRKITISAEGFFFHALRSDNDTLRQLHARNSQIQALPFPTYRPAPAFIDSLDEHYNYTRSLIDSYGFYCANGIDLYDYPLTNELLSKTQTKDVAFVVTDLITTGKHESIAIHSTLSGDIRVIELVPSGFCSFSSALAELSDALHRFIGELDGQSGEVSLEAQGQLSITGSRYHVTRIAALKGEVAALEAGYQNLPKDSNAGHRIIEITDLILRAKSREVVSASSTPALLLSFANLVMRAQVAIDAISAPDIDPTVGWCRLEEYDHDLMVNTQLARYFFEDGSISAIEYYPRKTFLIPPLNHIRSFNAHLVGDITAAAGKSTKHKILKRAKDVSSFRFTQQLLPGLVLVRDFTFRGGIGAHLANSTTGFAIEFWLEGTVPVATDISIEWLWSFPTLSAELLRAQVLMCVGGVAEKSDPLVEPLKFDQTSVPGGVYGVRLTDAVEDLVTDFRSSKQLNSLELRPVIDDRGEFSGTAVSLIIEARRIIGDDKSVTIFVSIV